MNFIKKLSPLVLGFILLAGSAIAQTQQQSAEPAEDVSDQELEMLVSFALESQAIQRDVNMKMQQAINEEENINLQRFQVIQQSKQNPQMADSVEITAEEEAAVASLQPKLEKIGQDAQAKAQKLLAQSELTQQRLQEIQLALQSDTELQQRFQSEMMKQQKAMQSEENDS